MRGMLPSLTVALLLAAALPMAAQKKYTGPPVPKSDVPYLLHASNLIEVETATAQESSHKDDQVFAISGATSPTRTPVPEPIFIFKADRVNPDHIALYRMESKGGQRSVTIPSRPGGKRSESSRPVFILVNALDNHIFKIEVNEPLENGEYCLSPEGTNTSWCFTEF